MQTGFGTTLKALRQELGLSQSTLADRLGTTQRHLSFLETGRSQPGRAMISRLVAELDLSAGQRAAMFEASGYRNPYRRREFSSDEVTATLDMMQARLLANWPFPAMVLDEGWTILRMNRPAQQMFAPFSDGGNAPLNLNDMLMSDAFRQMIVNWEEARPSLYFRLQSAAAHSPLIAEKLKAAKAAGLFDGISDDIMDAREIPIYVPLSLRAADGMILNITSLLGRLMSVHDAVVEGFEVELMVPLDAGTEACMRNALSATVD